MSTIYASPPQVRVHYRADGVIGSMSGFVHASQGDDTIALVINPAAAGDPHACCWRVRTDQVQRIEVLDPGAPADIMGEMVAAVAVTPTQRIVLDALSDHGPVQWCDVTDALAEVGQFPDRRQVDTALQGLKATGRITITHTPGAASGVVTVN